MTQVNPGPASASTLNAQPILGGRITAAQRLNPTADLLANTTAVYQTPDGAVWQSTGTALVPNGVAASALNPASMALLGDSYFANGSTYAGTVRWSENGQSWWQTLNALLGNPWDLVYDGSIGGTNTSGWIANQLPGVLTSGAATVLICHPTNDAIQLGNLALSLSNLASIFSQVQAAGKAIVIATCGNVAAWTGAQRGIGLAISDYMVGVAYANGWPVLDILGSLYDPATNKGSTGLFLNESGVFVHPNPAGALIAATQSFANFSRIPARPVNSMNGPQQAFYNTAMNGDTAGVPDGWTGYSNGTPTSTARSKVASYGARSLVRNTGTSDAAGSRWGISTASISLTAAWSTGAKALGARAKGSFGDHWVCTTAGTSSGTEPGAMAAASSTGDTVTDSGGVVWTRYKNVIPGASKLTFRLDFDINTVSAGDLAAAPVILVAFTGGSPAYTSIRGNSPAATTDPAQRWGFTRTRNRPVVWSPYQVPVPAGVTGMQLFLYQQWSAAATVSTFDIYGIECRID